MFRTKRSKKGLSGAVTALILVIASVIIALVVVGFAFGLFGAFGGTPTVTQVGTGTITTSGIATITLKSSGTVNIVSAQIVGTTYTANTITGSQLKAGFNTVTISFSFGSSDFIQPGSTYTISLALSDGATVQVSVLATS